MNSEETKIIDNIFMIGMINSKKFKGALYMSVFQYKVFIEVVESGSFPSVSARLLPKL
ncbi:MULTISPECIES: hypothetical protein [Bacillus]|uniref:hypothetical protein n=1 Tax=Bacillus TaxID=1386 RepID=UPI0003313BD6|nr:MULTISPECIES: hypothetical protein [Bacillus cereus group]EOP67488.1 hypothetical protein KOW_04135 [Bacillus cereus VDM006]EOQ02933.1 hypothetical protein KOY_00783 [Bacillus cereus VDM021]MDF2086284.1 hypothetical protein [Bacillus pseudomycoides]OOG90469.1 hypothetical protein BTH41_03190 [Bacillus mycoides]